MFVNAEHAVRVLNRIHAADPTVLPTLIAHRVECNSTLAADPTVQVGCDHAGGPYKVGLLGIINGIFGIREPDGSGYIGAEYDDERDLSHFVVLPKVAS